MSEEIQTPETTEPRSHAPTTAFPTTLADLQHHLPSTNSTTKSIYSTLSALRKSTLSIPNRLTSILHDADFIQALHAFLGTADKPKSWPLIPNERSGSWPLNPDLKRASQEPYLSTMPPSSAGPAPVSAYFKSTDGHINQWSFSPRRLNLPVLSLLGHANSAVLIDTTRRGKSYPDALRRTVPIWCAVWNCVLFPDDTVACEFQALDLDRSEIAQIQARIPGFVAGLKELGLDLQGIRARVEYPVRCVWVVQPGERWEWEGCFEAVASQIELERSRFDGRVNVLMCCSASKRVVGAEMSEDGYIQGAGDDSEGWSCGLTAGVFWDHREELMRAVAAGADLEDLVLRCVAETKAKGISQSAVLIEPTRNVFLAAHAGGSIDGEEEMRDLDLIIDCNDSLITAKKIGLGCKDGKLGSKMLRDKLNIVKTRMLELLRKSQDAKVLVVCSTGRDLSAGVVLAILCCFFDDQGYVQPEAGGKFDKQFIRQRLAWITSSKPDANPSRATLQAVNSFLMDRPD